MSPWKSSLDVICAKGEKSCPPSIHVPVTPVEKGVDHFHSQCLFSSLLSPSFCLIKEELWFDNKGPSCLCLDEALLSSLLPPPSLSIPSKPPLISLTLSLPPLPLSHCLMPLYCASSPFLVRASAIQSGYGIKNQKVSLSRRHPDGALWCLLRNLKFICCHTWF